ncbi:hypothetical protein PshuTeo2_11790 [Pseudomonas hunanensis]|uniref:methylation-associated defense system protein MAD4 n=1 Tax=Pseudomonas hunanensis TaxID=1247546 RepID=UPI002AA0DF3B|nr:hypothetical protein [Pseudomonas hunanensis]MDY7071134.1 hypothetical protein [Pseudomonas hunanensis]
MIRPCVILVADSNMAAVFKGFFSRDRWDLSLGCSRFDFNAELGGDLLVPDDADPGVFTRAHSYLDTYRFSHSHAIVVLDCEWEGFPGRDAIVTHITANLVASGWAEDAVKVIAIEPELENWLWQDKPQVADVLRYKGDKSLRQHLAESGWWPADAAKPPRPKEAAEWVLKQTRQPRSSAIYQKLAEHISIKGCTDAAFAEMHAAFLAWFPVEAAA